ncbi:MAG TPA: AsmA family protein [Terriglobia bacterium]
MTARRKIALTVLVLLAVLALVLIVVIPRLADLDRYRPQVIARIEEGTGRSVEIGRLSLRVLPALSVRADSVAIGNPPGFPPGHFLEIQRVYAELDPGALLHREIAIRSLKLEGPIVRLISNSQGHWNTESPERPRAALRPTAWRAAAAPSILITTVEVEDGRAMVASTVDSEPLGPPSLEADGVSAKLQDVNPDALGVHLFTAGSAWTGGPRGNHRGRAKRPVLLKTAWRRSAEIELPRVEDVAVSEIVGPGGPLAAHGTLSAKSVRFGAIQAAGVRCGLELYSGGVLVDGLVLQLFGGQITGNLVWDTASRPRRYTTHLSLSGIDVARALMAFPSAGGKLTGTLEGQIDLTGWSSLDNARGASGDPLDNKQGRGQVTVRSGTLPGIRLNRDLMALIKNVIRSGSASADPSVFSSMSADLEIAEGQIRSRQISILGNGIDLDASGTLALGGAGRLNYQGVAKISARQNAVGNLVAGLLGSKMSAGGQISFPFTLTGTLVAPHFDAPRSPILH